MMSKFIYNTFGLVLSKNPWILLVQAIILCVFSAILFILIKKDYVLTYAKANDGANMFTIMYAMSFLTDIKHGLLNAVNGYDSPYSYSMIQNDTAPVVETQEGVLSNILLTIKGLYPDLYEMVSGKELTHISRVHSGSTCYYGFVVSDFLMNGATEAIRVYYGVMSNGIDTNIVQDFNAYKFQINSEPHTELPTDIKINKGIFPDMYLSVPLYYKAGIAIKNTSPIFVLLMTANLMVYAFTSMGIPAEDVLAFVNGHIL